MKYKIGDIVEIKDRLYGHQFKIGQKVKIAAEMPELHNYKAHSLDEKHSWYIEDNEIKSPTKYNLEIIKDITPYAILEAHKNQYRWGRFDNSCATFQDDFKGILRYTDGSLSYILSEGDIKILINMNSAEFKEHLVTWGFIKFKEETFSCGDLIEIADDIGVLYIIQSTGLGTLVLASVSSDIGNRWDNEFKVEDVDRIRKDEIPHDIKLVAKVGTYKLEVNYE